MKRKVRKLVLTRETIHNLDRIQLTGGDATFDAFCAIRTNCTCQVCPFLFQPPPFTYSCTYQ
jgi:hypothetical protein